MKEINNKDHNKISGIYIAKWINSDYIYIGQSVNLYKRKLSHIQSINKKKHQNKKINDISKKYGLPKFYVLEYCDKDNLNFVEQKYLDLYFDNCNKCLNVVKTASSSIGHKMPPRSKEYREKLSKSLTGRVFSKEHIKNLSISQKGKKLSQKQIDALVKSNKGVKRSIETKLRMSKALTGRILTNDHRIKIGKTKIGNTYRRGSKCSDDHKRKVSEAKKKDFENSKRISKFNEERKIPIIQKDLNDIIIQRYESITNASTFGFDRSSIRKCLIGEYKKHKGFKWEYDK